MWILAFYCSPDAQGVPPTAKSREVHFSAQDTRLPSWSHLPREKVQTKGCVWGGARPLLPGVAALLTLAWLEQEAMPGLAGWEWGRGKGRAGAQGLKGTHYSPEPASLSFQGNLTEGGRGALGPCHWTLICSAKAGGCPRVNSFLSEESPENWLD